jgi:hypothetical protein
MRLTLTRHPATACAAITRIEVQVKRHSGDQLELHFFAFGDVEAVKWPAHTEAKRGERLWEESCFECFVRRADWPVYHEFNLATSSQWAAYRFTDYRSGMQVARLQGDPDIRTRPTAKTQVLQARLDLNDLPGLLSVSDWQLGFSAVIEEKDGTKSYWALKHPPGKPDFHHPDCFALSLPATGQP